MSRITPNSSGFITAGLSRQETVAVSRRTHATGGWKRPNTYEFARALDAVVIVRDEVPISASSLPLALIPATPGPILVALLGLTGIGHIVDEAGRWRAPYVPSLLRVWPFTLATAPDGSAELHIESRSAAQNRIARDLAFFDESGSPSDALAPVIKFFETWDKARRQTRKACLELAELGLLEQLRHPSPDVELLSLDEKKFASLSDEAFLSLRSSGALSIAHALLISRHHLRDISSSAASKPVQGPQSSQVTSFLEALAEAQEHPDIL